MGHLSCHPIGLIAIALLGCVTATVDGQKWFTSLHETHDPMPLLPSFKVTSCTDRACSENCVDWKAPQDYCLHIEDGSVVVVCDGTNVFMLFFANPNCGSNYRDHVVPVGKCMTDDPNITYRVTCSNSAQALPLTPASLAANTDGQWFTPSAASAGPMPLLPSFKVTSCTDRACSENCVGRTAPQQLCLPIEDGSVKVTCSGTDVDMRFYEKPNCGGSSSEHVVPVGKCMTDDPNITYRVTCFMSEMSD